MRLLQGIKVSDWVAFSQRAASSDGLGSRRSLTDVGLVVRLAVRSVCLQWLRLGRNKATCPSSRQRRHLGAMATRRGLHALLGEVLKHAYYFRHADTV